MQPLLMRWRCTTGRILLRRRRRMLPSSSSSSSSSCNPNKFPLSVIIGSDTPSESSSSHLPMLSSSSSKFSHNKSNLLRGNKNTLVVFSKSLSGGGPRNHRAYSSSVSGIMQEHADTVDEENNLLVVVSFYKFADFPDHADMRMPLKDLCQELRVSGGIILAPEGINGSICGSRESVEAVLRFIQSDNRLNGLRRIESPVSPEEEAIHHHGHTSTSPLGAGEDAPFRWDHVRVKLKKEIVSLGLPTVSPMERVGKYVNPRDWNALINDPDTVVIDVRNNYETRIGKFRGAVDPCTVAFREFPSWVDDNLEVGGGGRSELDKVEDVKEEEECNGEGQVKKPARVAMYCTGGIRCEKASSFLLSKGVKEVYHLEGGILKYLEEIPKEESMWEGECFVFDKRVSVEHGLGQGTFKLCYGCKQPVSDVDMESPLWEYGVSCPYCFSTTSQQEKDRARARQTQFQTWGVIGGPHKGRRPPPPKPTPAGGDNNVTDYQRMGG